MSDIVEIEAHRNRAQAAYDKLPLSGPVGEWCEMYGEDLLDSCTKLLAHLKQRTDLIDAAAKHWLESCRVTSPPIPWEGAIDGAMEAACKEIKRLRARLEVSDSGYDGISCRDETIKNQDGIIQRLRAENAKLREAVTWRPLFDEDKDEWIVPEDVDVLLFMPSTHPQFPAEIKAGFARSTKGGWYAGWATHWLPLPEAPR